MYFSKNDLNHFDNSVWEKSCRIQNKSKGQTLERKKILHFFADKIVKQQEIESKKKCTSSKNSSSIYSYRGSASFIILINQSLYSANESGSLLVNSSMLRAPYPCRVSSNLSLYALILSVVTTLVLMSSFESHWSLMCYPILYIFAVI